MEITVKNLADEVGVSKQAIMDKIKKLGLQSDLTRNGNRFVLSKEQANLVKSAFQRTRQEETQSNFAKQNGDLLYDIVKTLQSEIEVKNKQIEYLQDENRRLSEMISHGQALHAGTIQKQLLEDGSGKKKSFFSRLFKGGDET